jgi:hypothetical protein
MTCLGFIGSIPGVIPTLQQFLGGLAAVVDSLVRPKLSEEKRRPGFESRLTKTGRSCIELMNYVHMQKKHQAHGGVAQWTVHPPWEERPGFEPREGICKVF